MNGDTKSHYDSYNAAALRFIEEVSTHTPQALNTSIAQLNQSLQDKELPQIYTSKNRDGTLKEARLDNGIVYDTPLYIKPQLRGKPLADPSLERLAQHFEAVKALQSKHGSKYNLLIFESEMKTAGEFLRDEASKLGKLDQYEVLKRAGDASYAKSYSKRHSFNVVFADLDEDGKAEELSDIAINYQRSLKLGSFTERIDIFDPPAPPEKKR